MNDDDLLDIPDFLRARRPDQKPLARQNVRLRIDAFADYRDRAGLNIHWLRLAITEPYLRRRLGLKKRDPLVYRGLQIAVTAHHARV